MRAAWRTFVVVAFALSPVTAWAQEPPSASPRAEQPPPPLDTVFLRNGGLYRGHISEIVPDDHVTLMMDSGEAKKIPWAEIDRVVMAPPTSGSAETPKPKIPAAETTPPQTIEAGPHVNVHINSPKPAMLYRRPIGSNGWSLVCRSPCDKELPATGSYRIDGNGMASSKEISFRTTANTTHMELRVDPSSSGTRALGGVMIGVGVLASYVGLAVTLGDDEDDEGSGLVAFAVGAVLMVTGIFVYRGSSTSSVTQQTTESASPPKADPLTPDKPDKPSSSSRNKNKLDAFVREAVRRGPETYGAPPAMFPVLLKREF